MALSGIERLKRLVPAPVEPVEAPRPGDWDEVEARLDLVFPSDYKAFIQLYGSGVLDGFLTVLNPFSANKFIRFPDASDRQLETIRWLRAQGNERLPYPIYPEPGGLLEWAETANGDCFYWITSDAQPDEWLVTANESSAPHGHDHPGPMTAFLADLLDRTTSVDFFPSVFPSATPTFEP